MRLGIALLVSALLLGACAGEKVAQRQATKAAGLLADLKQHTEQSVESYRFDRSQEYRLVNEYAMNRADGDAQVRTHRAMWQSAGHKEAEELFKANSGLAGLTEIRNSAPFIAITPPPAFNAPKLNSDEMKSLIVRLNKLASPLAPSERLEFLLKLFDQAGKAYAEANKAAKANNATPLLSTGTAAKISKDTNTLKETVPLVVAETPVTEKPFENPESAETNAAIFAGGQ